MNYKFPDVEQIVSLENSSEYGPANDPKNGLTKKWMSFPIIRSGLRVVSYDPEKLNFRKKLPIWVQLIILTPETEKFSELTLKNVKIDNICYC